MQRIKNGVLGALGLVFTFTLIGAFATVGLAVLGMTVAIGIALAGVGAIAGLAGHVLPQDRPEDEAST